MTRGRNIVADGWQGRQTSINAPVPPTHMNLEHLKSSCFHFSIRAHRLTDGPTNGLTDQRANAPTDEPMDGQSHLYYDSDRDER